MSVIQECPMCRRYHYGPCSSADVRGFQVPPALQRGDATGEPTAEDFAWAEEWLQEIGRQTSGIPEDTTAYHDVKRLARKRALARILAAAREAERWRIAYEKEVERKI